MGVYLICILVGIFILACITGDLLFWAIFITILVLILIADLISFGTSYKKPRRKP